MIKAELNKQDLNDIRALLSMREGARFLSRILELAGIFRISYMPGQPDVTAFKEGARNIGLIVYQDIVEVTGVNGLTPLMAAAKEREITEGEE